MSSKSASGRATKELLVQLLRLIETGSVSSIPARKLQYFKRYSYVSPTSSGYTLTPKGKKALHESAIWELAIPTPNRWDGKWRLVLFDIPVDKRKRRDIFRLRIKELGLILYQNSVWVYPYPIEETIGPIAHFYKLSSCISFITAEKISGESSLRKQFNL